MLNLTSPNKIVGKNYIYLYFLDSFLDGVSEQRDRIKEIDNKLTGGIQKNREEFFNTQKALFREIRVFFWWWHSIYKILYLGEKRTLIKPKILIKIGHFHLQKAGRYSTTPSLARLLGSDFINVIDKYRADIKSFSDTRHDLEHILERIDAGEHKLGDLYSNGSSRKFLFGSKETDISDAVLDKVDLLVTDINNWLSQ